MSRKIKQRPGISRKTSLAAPGATLQDATQAHRNGDLSRAESLYRAILAAQPRHADTLNMLATLYQQQGKFQDAIPLLTRAIAQQPSQADYHCNLGSALRSAGELEKASTAFRKALARHPGHLEAQFNLAMTRRELGDLEGARDEFRVILLTKPSFIPAHEMLAQIMLEQGLLDEALACFQEIIHFAPQHNGAFFESGNILQATGRLAEAVAAYQQAIAITPAYAAAHNNLGNTLVKQGKLHEALTQYQEAIRGNPDLGEAYVNLSWTYKEHGMIAEDIACLNQYLARRPEDYKAHSDLLFSMNYHPAYSPEQLYVAAQGWWRQHGPKQTLFTHQPRLAGQKLRIGFLSPDFRQHPVGSFLLPLFSAMDKQAAGLHCYAEMHDRQLDAVSHRLRSSADSWTSTINLSAAEAATMIHRDRIDILIDLAGHSANNRLDIMALKPAPVQVSWLGYVNTTGLPVIDYRLTDQVADPPGSEAWHSERLLRLPDAFFCYEPPAAAPAIGPLPALEQGKITFGSLNNPAKISPEVIALWSQILLRTPLSRLVMVGAPFADEFIANRYRSLFAEHGVDPARIALRATLPMDQYLQLYNTIDIALDPFPHNGHTITCHTLWMGVPVVTLMGNRYAARMGASVLHGVGLPELAAPTAEDYIAVSTTLAADIDRLTHLRASMRERMRQSRICDPMRFAGDFLQAIQTMTGSYSSTTEPLHFNG